MHLRYRPERKKWEICFVLNGERKRLLFDVKKEAQDILKDLKLGKLGLKEQTGSTAIALAFKEYFEVESSKKDTVSRGSDQRYFNLAFHFLTVHCKKEFIEEVTLQDLVQFQTWVQKAHDFGDEKKSEWSEGTTKRCCGLLKTFFRKRMHWGALKNPAEYWVLPEVHSELRKPIRPDQYKIMLSRCPNWFVPILEFLYHTGARGSSVERLTWRDVDLHSRTFVLKTRKGRSRQIRSLAYPMTDEVFKVLVSVRNSRSASEGDSDSVFVNSLGEPITAFVITKTGTKLIKASGLKGKVVLYGLRHALATDLTMAGVPTEMVRQVLGHAKISSTQNYAKGLSHDSLREAMNQRNSQPPTATKNSGASALRWLEKPKGGANV